MLAPNPNPCAACKAMKWDCTNMCVFAPHFPSSEPDKFERVNRVFGAENVEQILIKVAPWEREKTVSALCYEAEARIQDPICGFVGRYFALKNELKKVNEQIDSAKNELAAIIGPDKVPQYTNRPMPDDFLSTQSNLHDFIQGMGGLTQDQKDQLKQLSASEAERILDGIFWKRGNGDGHGDAGASTSAGPSRT